MEKMVHRPPFKKLWIGVREIEDREGWMENARVHCEWCFDDDEEPSWVQEQTMLEQSGGETVGRPGRRRRVEVTVDRVLRARGKIMENKATGSGVCLVSEMLWELPMDSV